MQTLHGSPPSHNNTTPSPLAATQLLPPSRRRGSSCYPRLHHCSFPRSFPPTLLPPSHHLFSGCAAYDSPRTLSKVKLASFYLPPSSPSSLLEFLRLAPYRTAYFLPLFYSPLFLPPAFSLSLLISRPRYFSLLPSLFLSPHSHRRRRSRGRDRGRCRAYQTSSALGRHRGNK